MRGLSWAAGSAVALFFLAGSVATGPLSAQESGAAKTLTPGKGADLTMARCAICHDITHVTRTRLSRGEWEDNVRNMVERGAPIAPGEVAVIVDYLAAFYSRDGAAPPPDSVVASDGAAPDPVQGLLAGNACIGCHGVDQRIVGPSFREVAVRYAGDDGAKAALAAKIRAGGAGAWGQVPMPAHPGLTDADLAQLVGWILSRK